MKINKRTFLFGFLIIAMLIPVVNILIADDSLLYQKTQEPPNSQNSQNSQTPENATLTPTTEEDNLFVLCKVWGLMKYYHPKINGQGQTFDDDLIALLPLMRASKTIEERDAILAEWIESYGTFPIKKGAVKLPVQYGTALDKFLNTQWIENLATTQTLKTKLREIASADRSAKNVAETAPYQQKQDFLPQFGYEAPYAPMKYPDENYRLLALYRFWNVFEYFSPNKDLLDRPWDETLKVLIPEFLAATTELEYQMAIHALARATDDGHGFVTGTENLLKAELGDYRVPVTLDFIENQAVVVGTAYRDTDVDHFLKVGDIVTAIDGTAVKEGIEAVKPFSAASNETLDTLLALKKLTYAQAEISAIEVIRNGEPLTFISPAYPMNAVPKDNAAPLEALHWLDEQNHTLYLDYNQITKDQLTSFEDLLKTAKALVIDLRGYPDIDMLHMEIAKYLMPETKVFAQLQTVYLDYPGHFFSFPYVTGEPNKDYFKGEVVCLTDHRTGSHTEFTALAFAVAPKAKIVGSQTAGQDGNIVDVPIPGGYSIYYSSLGVHKPDGTETQRVGIVPDVEVVKTLQSVINGEDLYIEAALATIEDMRKQKP